MSLPCVKINSLGEFSMIAGSHEILEFHVYEEDAITPVDLSQRECKWTLAPFGQPNITILEVNGVVTLPNMFSIELLSSMTMNLEAGRYIHQPIVIDYNGEETRNGQGIMVVIPRIPD